MQNRFLHGPAYCLFVLPVLIALLLSATHEGRVLARTAALVTEVLPNMPVRPLLWFRPAALRETVSFPTAAGEAKAEVYRPPGPGRYPALILMTGVTPNLEDPDLRRLLEGLARSGIVALLPHSAHMLQGTVNTDDVETAVGAFRFLQSREYVNARRVGLAGFSVGASMLAIAAADGRIRDDVAVLNFFGGYYDAGDYVTEVVTESVSYDGQTRAWSTRPQYAPLIKGLLIATRENARDRDLLQRSVLKGEQVSAGEWARLSPDGLRVHEFLTNRDPAKGRELRERLPPSTQTALRALSPSQVADRLTTRVFIMHDRADPVIPYEESRRLRDRMASLTPPGRFSYTEFSLFEHMNPTRGLDPVTFTREAARLMAHLYGVMLALL